MPCIGNYFLEYFLLSLAQVGIEVGMDYVRLIFVRIVISNIHSEI